MAEAPSSSNLSESERALRSTLFDFTSWQVGKTHLSELFEVFKGMKVDDVSRITCPMLCLGGLQRAALPELKVIAEVKLQGFEDLQAAHAER